MASLHFEQLHQTAPRHFLNASFGELDKIAFDDTTKKDRIDQIFREISTTGIQEKGYDSSNFYCRVDWALETVTLIDKGNQKRKVSVSLGDASLHTSDKIRQLIREGKKLLFSEHQLKDIKLPKTNSLGLPAGTVALSAAEHFSAVSNDFTKVAPFIEPHLRSLSSAEKHQFYRKLQIAIKTHSELKTLFSLPPAAPTLEERFSAYKTQLVKLAQEQQDLEETIDLLGLRNLSSEIETKRTELEEKKGEITRFKEQHPTIESDYGKHITLLEYRKIFANVDVLAIALNLLHTDAECFSKNSATKTLQLLESSQRLLQRPSTWFSRFFGMNPNIPKEQLEDYAIDIEALGKRDFESKSRHYFQHHKTYKEGSKAEELILSLVQAKMIGSANNIIDIDPRLDFLKAEISDINLEIDEALLFDATTGRLKSLGDSIQQLVGINQPALEN